MNRTGCIFFLQAAGKAQVHCGGRSLRTAQQELQGRPTMNPETFPILLSFHGHGSHSDLADRCRAPQDPSIPQEPALHASFQNRDSRVLATARSIQNLECRFWHFRIVVAGCGFGRRPRNAFFFPLLTWNCASRHNGEHFFDSSTFKALRS